MWTAIGGVPMLVKATVIGTRIAVVTTARGIGGRIAADLSDSGARVVTVGDAPMDSGLEHVASDLFSRVETDRALEAAMEVLGGLDALVHAAPLPDVPLIAATEAMCGMAWVEASETPVRRAMFTLQSAYPYLSRTMGQIVLVQPTIGISGVPGGTAISTAVEGQRILGKVAARQWGACGVSVNFLLVSPELAMPGMADLALIKQLAEIGTGNAPPAQRSLGGSEVARDVSPLVAFLASTAGGRMTGQTLIADGGVWMLP